MTRASRYRLALPAIAAGLALASPASAQAGKDGLTISGDMRLRFEAIDGQPRAGFNSSDQFVDMRTKLRLDWQGGPLKLVAEVMDSRVWGANAKSPLTTNEVNTVEPVQAYAQFNFGPVLGQGSKLTAQAGRFTLDLGSRRLIATDDYRNTVTSFTGLRTDVATSSGVKATLIYVLPQTRLPDDAPSLLSNAVALDKESFASVLWGGFFSRQHKGSPRLGEVSFLHFGERDTPGRPTRDRSLNSVGLRASSDPRPGHFDGGAEVIYQWGNISASAAPGAANQAVSASYWRAHFGYSFVGKWHPHLLAEFDRASGDDPKSGTYTRFDPLFGMRRADLGPAGLYNSIGRSNLLSPGIRLEVTPSKRVDGFIGYRALWLADRADSFSTTGLRDASGKAGSFAGHQIDARVRLWLIPDRLRAEVDGVWLGKSDYFRLAPNATPGGDTHYASFNLSAFF